MREIKFKVYWNKQKVMTSVDTISFLQGGTYISDGCMSEGLAREDCKLLQYTGLKDKNGKEIYEGDICRVVGDEPYSNDYFTTDYDWTLKMVVKFEYGCFELQTIHDTFMTMYFCETEDMVVEVIGNIYENPELLEATEC